MPPHARREREVLCPFFRSFGDRRIVSEGHHDAVITLTQLFRNNEAMDLHIETFCDNHFCKCEIYTMILRTKFGADLE